MKYSTSHEEQYVQCYTPAGPDLAVEPEIYLDEKEEDLSSLPEKEEIPHTFSDAFFFLDTMDRVLALVHSRKELKILRMRLKGMSYRQIASSLHIGLASINRFIKRIASRNPQVGILLENAPSLRNRNIP